MSTKTILLVEDDPDDEFLTLRALKKAGVANKIEVAHDGVEALDYLFCRDRFAERDPSETPAVVLLDLKLPRLDGHGVLRAIRADERSRNLPVVILSSSSQKEDVDTSYSEGANSYVRKPVQAEEFFEAVRRLGLYWLVVNESP